jgi:cysteine desulfurase
MGTDLMSLSGHKIYGPKGIGALLIKRDIQSQIEPLIYGGGQQSGLRSGTLPVPLCVGLAHAIEMMSSKSASAERIRVRALRDKLWTMLQALSPMFTLNGPQASERHPGNLSVSFCGYDAHDLIGMMQPNLAVSTGSACSSGIPEPSHVLRAIGLSGDQAESTIRFGLGRFSSEEDIMAAADFTRLALHKLVCIA